MTKGSLGNLKRTGYSKERSKKKKKANKLLNEILEMPSRKSTKNGF